MAGFFNSRQTRYSRQFNDPKRQPSPKPLDLCIYHVTGKKKKRELRLYTRLQLLTKWWRIYTELYWWAQSNDMSPWVLKSRRETDRKEGQRYAIWKRLNLLLFKLEETDITQWIQVASTSWKRQILPQASRYLSLSPGKSMLDFWSIEL